MLRRFLASSMLAIVLVMAGCASTVHLEPAPGANATACADAAVRFPDAIGDLDRRWTDAQATAAWGASSTAVIVSCGWDAPAPTTQQCVTIDSVDWIVDESERPNLRLQTYGRQPAIEVYVDTTVVSADSVLALSALGSAAAQLPATTRCTEPDVAEEEGADAPTTGAEG